MWRNPNSQRCDAMNIKTLIDKASEKCGSDKALAERMDVKANVISMLRHGRPISPETAAELAFIAHENIAEAINWAILERAKGTRREGVLRAILGKGIAAGVAGMLAFSYSADSTASSVSSNKSNKLVSSLYIVECQRAEKYRLFKRRMRAVICCLHPARLITLFDRSDRYLAFF
jgi:hypothetical protein